MARVEIGFFYSLVSRLMDVRATFPIFRSALSWFVLLAAIAFAVLWLNGAAFSAWMSDGPPNPYPHGWALRSQAQLSYACASLVGGAAVFRIIRTFPVFGWLSVGLVVLALGLAVSPSIIRFFEIDRCLDSGGRWSYEGLQCEH